MKYSRPELKSTIVSVEKRPVVFGNDPDLSKHLSELRGEFGGMPELCFVHAALIAKIRRQIDLVEHVPHFLDLWAEESEFLAAHLNSRWLLSAADTFADHGTNTQRLIGSGLSGLFHALQLCETERLAVRDPASDQKSYAAVVATHKAKRHIELWDGIKAYAFEDGDSARLALGRVAAAASQDSTLDFIFRTLLARSLESDTLFGRLARLNPGFLPPEISGLPTPMLPPRLMGSLEGYNIVLFKKRYICVPQSLGPIDLEQTDLNRLHGVVVVGSILHAIRAVKGATVNVQPAETI